MSVSRLLAGASGTSRVVLPPRSSLAPNSLHGRQASRLPQNGEHRSSVGRQWTWASLQAKLLEQSAARRKWSNRLLYLRDVHHRPPKRPTKDIIGGAGAYSALGARLLSPHPQSGSVGWVVDAGSDFPQEIRDSIAEWNTSCVVRETPWRLTTRAWNGYDEYERRAFKYLTPKLRLDATALPPSLRASNSFHLICNPTRCVSLVTELRERPNTIRDSYLTGPTSSPLFIWEPVPDMCKPEELANCYECLRHVDIVSPNHTELGAFFGHSETDAQTGDVDKGSVKKHCDAWLGWGIGGESKGAVVVRAGKDGCYVATAEGSKWIPPYHEPGSSGAGKVVDPTGGGNAFLGGLAIGMVRNGGDMSLRTVEEAAVYASVAASFAIEQVGMPSLQEDQSGERWNGHRVQDRLEEFKKRLETYVQA